MNEAWVHNISPFLWEITSGFGIRWYGMAYLVSFLIVYMSTLWLARRNLTSLKVEEISDFVTYGAIGALAGGRLGYAVFYAPDLFITFHSNFPFWALLEVNKGGMASHGGFLGVVVGCFLYARKRGHLASHLLDLGSFGAGLGFFFGRLANFINGELYGRECRPDLWMAVKFPSEIYTWGSADVEKLKSLGPAVDALGSVTTSTGEQISATADLWREWVNTFSFQAQRNIEFFKEAIVLATQKHNTAVISALGPALTPRYPSQLIQAFLEGLLVFLILFWVWRYPRKPGVISAFFGLCYAISRIIGEQFRLPDLQIGFQALGLTRGQWLSLAMVLSTLIYLIFVLRRRIDRVGGWKGGATSGLIS